MRSNTHALQYLLNPHHRVRYRPIASVHPLLYDFISSDHITVHPYCPILFSSDAITFHQLQSDFAIFRSQYCPSVTIIWKMTLFFLHPSFALAQRCLENGEFVCPNYQRALEPSEAFAFQLKTTKSWIIANPPRQTTSIGFLQTLFWWRNWFWSTMLPWRNHYKHYTTGPYVSFAERATMAYLTIIARRVGIR